MVDKSFSKIMKPDFVMNQYASTLFWSKLMAKIVLLVKYRRFCHIGCAMLCCSPELSIFAENAKFAMVEGCRRASPAFLQLKPRVFPAYLVLYSRVTSSMPSSHAELVRWLQVCGIMAWCGIVCSAKNNEVVNYQLKF